MIESEQITDENSGQDGPRRGISEIGPLDCAKPGCCMAKTVAAATAIIAAARRRGSARKPVIRYHLFNLLVGRRDVPRRQENGAPDQHNNNHA